MKSTLDHLWWLKSQKFWALIAGMVAIVTSSLQTEPFPTEDFTMKMVALIVGFMASKAWEDGKKAEAGGTGHAAHDASVHVSDPGQVIMTGEVSVNPKETPK